MKPSSLVPLAYVHPPFSGPPRSKHQKCFFYSSSIVLACACASHVFFLSARDWVPTFSGVWYGTLAAQRGGGVTWRREKTVAARRDRYAPHGGSARGDCRPAPYPHRLTAQRRRRRTPPGVLLGRGPITSPATHRQRSHGHGWQSEWRKQPENKKNEHVEHEDTLRPPIPYVLGPCHTAPHLDDLGRQPLFQQLAQTIFRPRGTARRYVGTPTSESQQRRLNVERRLAVLAKTACCARWLAVDRRSADTPTSEPQQRRLDVERRLAVPAKTACRTRWLAVDRRRR